MTTDEFIDSIIPSKWEYEYADLVKVVEAESEACAQIADEYANGPERNYSDIIADKIRARKGGATC